MAEEIDPSAPAYEIVRVEDTYGPVGSAFGPVKRVHLTLFDGTSTYVEIPVAAYSAAAVSAAADAVAKRHLSVVMLEAPAIGTLHTG